MHPTLHPMLHLSLQTTPSLSHKESSWKDSSMIFSTNFSRPRRKKRSHQKIWKVSFISSRWSSNLSRRSKSQQAAPTLMEVSRPHRPLEHPFQLRLHLLVPISTVRLVVLWPSYWKTSTKIIILRSSKASTSRNGSNQTGSLEVCASRPSSRTRTSSSLSFKARTIRTSKTNWLPQIFWVSSPSSNQPLKLMTRLKLKLWNKSKHPKRLIAALTRWLTLLLALMSSPASLKSPPTRLWSFSNWSIDFKSQKYLSQLLNSHSTFRNCCIL